MTAAEELTTEIMDSFILLHHNPFKTELIGSARLSMLVFDWLTDGVCQRSLGDRLAGRTWKLAQVRRQSKRALIKFLPWPADVEYLTLPCVESSGKQPDLITEGQLRSEGQHGAWWVIIIV